MGGSSSKPKNKSRITEQDKAILQLKQMRDKLKQYQERIELQLEKEREIARDLVKNGKIGKAKLLLKKKKYFEQNLEKTDGQLDNLDQLVHNIEYTQIEHQVVNGLKVGNDCLKKLHQMMSLDEVEQIMDDTRDSIEYQRKIDELLASQYDTEDIDEEINAELDSLLANSMPDVPNHELPSQMKQKEKNGKVSEKTKKIAVAAE